MPKPIRFNESEYFTWHERRQGEAQARRAFDAREQQEQATSEMLWGFGYIVVVPAVVFVACWLGSKL